MHGGPGQHPLRALFLQRMHALPPVSTSPFTSSTPSAPPSPDHGTFVPLTPSIPLPAYPFPSDHGTFVPLMLMFPEASIPVLQMSIMSSLDPAAHIKV